MTEAPQIDHGANPKAERAVLACILMDSRLLATARHALTHGSFTRSTHRVLFQVMCELDDAGLCIDVVAISDLLGGRVDPVTKRTLLEQCGGPTKIAQLSHAVPSTTVFDSSVRIVSERESRRALGRALEAATTRLGDGGDTSTTIAALNTDIDRLHRPAALGDDPISHARSIAETVMADLESGEPMLARLETGCLPVDALLDGGIALGMHHIFGALSGHGKTTFASAVASGLLQQHSDVHVDWYSCEVPPKYQFCRIASNYSNVPEAFWRRQDKSKSTHQMARAIEALGWGKELNSRLRIFHTPSINIRDVALTTAIRRRAIGDAPLVVIVDYIQRAFAGESHKQNERIAEASAQLASLADERTATIALTQFTQEAGSEPLPIPRPTMSRWAKDIENDACDFVIYHRPLQESCPPVALMQLAKSRYGRLAHVWALGSPSNRFDAFHRPGSDVVRALEATYPNVELRIPENVRGLHTPEIRP